MHVNGGWLLRAQIATAGNLLLAWKYKYVRQCAQVHLYCSATTAHNDEKINKIGAQMNPDTFRF